MSGVLDNEYVVLQLHTGYDNYHGGLALEKRVTNQLDYDGDDTKGLGRYFRYTALGMAYQFILTDERLIGQVTGLQVEGTTVSTHKGVDTVVLFFLVC